MKKAILLFCLFSISFSGKVYAQEAEKDSVVNSQFYRNSVYAEFLGNGLFGSLNYERIFQVSKNEKLALRLGGIYIPQEKYEGRNLYMFTVPVELSVFWGKRMIKPEIGIGSTIYQDNEGAYHSVIYRKVYPMIRLGFRFYYPNTAFLFRFGVVPFDMGPGWHPRYFPLPGISLGYSFGKK